MHLVASIRALQQPLLPGDCLCVGNHWVYTDNCVDAVDQLLIGKDASLVYRYLFPCGYIICTNNNSHHE